MRRRILNVICFCLWLAVGHLVVLYGRYFFRRALADGDPAMSAPGLHAPLILALACGAFGITRDAALGMQSKVFIGLVVGTAASVLMRIGSGPFSALACAVHFYLFFTGLVAVSLHDFLHRAMQKEFWNLLFDYMAKMIQYFLVLFVGGAAVLRYIYPEGRQFEFRADLYYCGIAVIFSFMFILYWVMVPAWGRLAEGYAAGSQAPPAVGEKQAEPAGHLGEGERRQSPEQGEPDGDAGEAGMGVRPRAGADEEHLHRGAEDRPEGERNDGPRLPPGVAQRHEGGKTQDAEDDRILPEQRGDDGRGTGQGAEGEK
jgi:hypothetical protein